MMPKDRRMMQNGQENDAKRQENYAKIQENDAKREENDAKNRIMMPKVKRIM